jgi:DNA/RNA-binding domain of Phe-tRNA-synthetase-like protein
VKFVIDKKLFEKFPGTVLGVVIAKGIDNTGTNAEITANLVKAQSEVRSKMTLESLNTNPKIEAWRKTYTAFGAKPKEHRSSIENLCKLVLSGVDLRPINKLVDIYNTVSLKHVLPAGGEDLNKMQGDLHLTFAGQAEIPVMLLGDKELKAPKEGEVIYKDEVSTICRRWNWREADRTKLTESTKNAILVIEGIPPMTKAEVESATHELHDAIKKFCGGTTQHMLLDKDKNETAL